MGMQVLRKGWAGAQMGDALTRGCLAQGKGNTGEHLAVVLFTSINIVTETLGHPSLSLIISCRSSGKQRARFRFPFVFAADLITAAPKSAVWLQPSR